MSTLSLKAKLMVAFLVVGMLPALILAWRGVAGANTAALEQTKSLQIVAEDLIDKIDRNLFERYGDVQAFASNPALLDRDSWYQRSEDGNRITRAANTYAQLYGIYPLLIVVDLDGKVIAVNSRDSTGKPADSQHLYDRNFANASWFRAAVAGDFLENGDGTFTGTVVEDLAVNQDVRDVYGNDGLVVTYTAPVRDASGKIVAVWHNCATWRLVEEIFVDTYRNLKRAGMETAELTLLDREGRVIVDLDPALNGGSETVAHDLDNVLLKLNLAGNGVEAAERAVAGETGSARSWHARKEIWQSAGFAHARGALGYPGLGWSSLVRVSEDEMLAVVNSTKVQVYLVLLGAIAVLGGVAWWLGRRISRPLERRVAQIGLGAEQVSSASTQVAGSSQSLSQGASEQAASLQETTAAVHTIADTIHATTRNAGEVGELVTAAGGNVDESNRALEAMVASMNEIDTSAREIERIIKTIDEIAFQTNLLALNAAVEAARAGDAGQGFAVVADEVRSLAQRAAEAAKDTASLIETAIDKSSRGNETLKDVSEAVGKITGSVDRVRELAAEVAETTGEQSDGIDQITGALSQMEQVTQQTAANAEESAAASEELTAQSAETKRLVEELQAALSGSR